VEGPVGFRGSDSAGARGTQFSPRRLRWGQRWPRRPRPGSTPAFGQRWPATAEHTGPAGDRTPWSPGDVCTRPTTHNTTDARGTPGVNVGPVARPLPRAASAAGDGTTPSGDERPSPGFAQDALKGRDAASQALLPPFQRTGRAGGSFPCLSPRAITLRRHGCRGDNPPAMSHDPLAKFPERGQSPGSIDDTPVTGRKRR